MLILPGGCLSNHAAAGGSIMAAFESWCHCDPAWHWLAAADRLLFKLAAQSFSFTELHGRWLLVGSEHGLSLGLSTYQAGHHCLRVTSALHV
jgi:hypothetical protein